MGGHVNDIDALDEGELEVQACGVCPDDRAEHGDYCLFLFSDSVESVKAYCRSSNDSYDDGDKKFFVP